MRHLILFLENPATGEARVRLRETLGADRVASLERAFVHDLVARLRDTPGSDLDHQFHLSCHLDDGETALRERLGEGLRYLRQEGPDQGVRLHAAFVAAHEAGAAATVVVAADCPTLSTKRVAEAFEALATHDVVLGPSRDGGYYLIGLQRPHADLFERIPWKSYAVLAETLARAWRQELTVVVLEEELGVNSAADFDELVDRYRTLGAESGVGPETARILDDIGT